jgi:UPF0755 protein
LYRCTKDATLTPLKSQKRVGYCCPTSFKVLGVLFLGEVHTPQEALTLASIVEKETGLPQERGRVAAVFLNRLRLGMKLQADPTTVYGIFRASGERKSGLSKRDLASDSPYNTYIIPGLPPGPITHPSQAAIEAVLNPPETAELYFVANGKGGHVFATTLDEHQRNAASYRNAGHRSKD